MARIHTLEICVNGWLADHWAWHFEGMKLDALANGRTLIHGEVADKATLFGVLRAIEELGLTVISITAFPKGDSR